MSSTSPFTSTYPYLLSTLFEQHVLAICTELHQEASSRPRTDGGYSPSRISTKPLMRDLLLEKLLPWVHHLLIFAEETIELFGLDEEEEDEEEEDGGEAVEKQCAGRGTSSI